MNKIKIGTYVRATSQYDNSRIIIGKKYEVIGLHYDFSHNKAVRIQVAPNNNWYLVPSTYEVVVPSNVIGGKLLC